MICAGFKRNGQPCCFKPRKGSSFCGHHQSKVLIPKAPSPKDSIHSPVDSVVDLSLSTRLPAELLGEAQRLLRVHKVTFELVPKGGQPWVGLWSYRNSQHKIQIEDTLTGAEFLETFVHEVAHAVKWDRHGRNGQTHGVEWKAIYRELMKPFLTLRCWAPHEKEKLTKPGAFKHVTVEDLRVLKPGCKFLMEAKKGQQFQCGGRDYTIVRRAAVFYRCLEVRTGVTWRIHKHTEISSQV